MIEFVTSKKLDMYFFLFNSGVNDHIDYVLVDQQHLSTFMDGRV